MDDPISLALRPPARETLSEKNERLKREAHAKKINDEIDKRLKHDAQQRKKETAGEYRILLLGQAAAGKTTVLKQMRLLYNPEAHDKERTSWKAVIHLNLVVAIRALIENLETTTDTATATDEPDPDPKTSTSTNGSSSSSSRVRLEHLRMAPILSLESVLRRRLGAVGEEDLVDAKCSASPVPWSWRSEPSCPHGRFDSSGILLRAGWQERLMDALRGLAGTLRDDSDAKSIAESTRGSVRSFKLPGLDRKNSSPTLGNTSKPRQQPQSQDPEYLLSAFKDDVLSLWNDAAAKRVRKRGKLDAIDSTV